MKTQQYVTGTWPLEAASDDTGMWLPVNAYISCFLRISTLAGQRWDFGPIAEKPCSQMACSLSQHDRSSSSRSHGDVTSYFLSLSGFVGPVLIFLSSSVSCLSGILWPISPRISLELLWRNAGATSWEKRSAENHQLNISPETSTRPNDPLKMKLARDAWE